MQQPKEFNLSIEESPTKADLEAFWDVLRKFNKSKAGEANYQDLCILVRDNDGTVIGGLNGEIFWGWLFIINLAVEEAFREHGLGSKLLQAAEDEARKRGCKAAYLDTYSFQALPFYEKHGYQVFGVLPDFPAGHKRIFLWKKLI